MPQWRWLAAALIALAAAGIGYAVWRQATTSTVGGDFRPVSSLEDLQGRWVATGVGTLPAALVDPHEVMLVIDGDRLSVATGCNTGGSLISVADSRLVVTQETFAMTAMACEGARGPQETWIVEMLTSQPRVERNGPMLALHWGESSRMGFELR